MLDAAVRDRRITSNPAAGVDLPRLPKSERQYLTHAKLADLASACGDYELFVLVLGYCGLRFGEAAALRVKRADTMRGRLTIAEAVTEINGRAVFGTPKTHGARAVVVPKFLRDRLVEHLAGRSADDLVFASPRGDVLRSNNFRRRVWNPACVSVGLRTYAEQKGKKKAPLYRGLVPHEMRHTAASIAIASGANVKAVQQMLGHASAAMTLDRYGHLFPDDLDAVADRIDAAARASADERAGSARGSAIAEVIDLHAKEA
jgi:integrase